MYSDKTWVPADLKIDTSYSRSYIIKAGDQAREYRRNKDMLMKTREEPHTIMPKHYHIPMFLIPKNRPRIEHSNIAVSEIANNVLETMLAPVINNPTAQSRSGRVTKKHSYLQDFITWDCEQINISRNMHMCSGHKNPYMHLEAT